MDIATAGGIIAFSVLAAEDITATDEAITMREAIMAGPIIEAIVVTEAGHEENPVAAAKTTVVLTAMDAAGIMAADVAVSTAADVVGIAAAGGIVS